MPAEFLKDVRWLLVSVGARVWVEGRWTDRWPGSAFPPNDELRTGLSVRALSRAAAAAEHALREGWTPRRAGAARGVEPPRVWRPRLASGGLGPEFLGLSVDLRVRDATEELPAAARPGEGLRVFAVSDRVHYRRFSLVASFWHRGLWQLQPGLVVAAAPAAELEERVIVRGEALVEAALAAVRDRFA